MTDIFNAWLEVVGEEMVYLPLVGILFHSIFSGLFEHFLDK